MLIGLLERILFIKKMNNRLEYTLEYRDKFVEFCNKTMATGKFSDSHYSFLAKDVNKIQRELGLDGIVSVYRDPLAGIQMNNYPIFLNFFSELRTELNVLGVFNDRLNLLIGWADEALLKHIGALEERIKAEKNVLKNPLYCFSKGIGFAISLPIKILEWCGILNPAYSKKVVSSKLYRAIEKVATLVGLVASVITVIMGWEWLINFCRAFIEK